MTGWQGGGASSKSASVPNSSYLESKSPHLPLHITPKLTDLPQSNCPQRALALIMEAFRSDLVAGKTLAKWIAKWNARRALRPASTKAKLEKWINKLEEE